MKNEEDKVEINKEAINKETINISNKEDNYDFIPHTEEEIEKILNEVLKSIGAI